MDDKGKQEFLGGLVWIVSIFMLLYVLAD